MDAATALGATFTPDAGIHYQPQGREVALFEHAYHNRLPGMFKGPTG